MRAAPSPQLHTLTLSQALEGLRTGAFTSVALTQSFLERIEAVEPAVSAWITVVGERALEQAARADARRAAGEESALLGIPFAAKDLLSTEGVRTTCGSKMLEHYIPPYTATAVRRLEDAGMVLLGKTNMDEFAMGSSTENSAWGVTHNPWNLQRVPGGSSGGSAAAVAAQMAPVALGSDTGGSIRLPASFCGVVGIRPSYGRVSRYGLVAYGSSLDQVGILSQTVRDAALLLEAIAGHDPLDSTSLPAPVPAYGRTLEGGIVGLRIGLPQEYLGEGLQPAVEEAVRGAVARFAELGATIVPISLPNTAHALPVYYLVATAEASANLARFDGVRFGHSAGADSIQENYRLSRSQGFGPEVKRRIMLGAYALSAGYYDAYYLKAQQVRTLIRDDFRRAFAQVDLIVGPVSATTAFPLGDRSDDPLAMYLTDLYTATLNLAGICGMSVPCGFDGEGLPIGLQLMGPSLGEERLLRAAHAFESATDWHLRRAAEAPLLGKQLPA